MTAGRDPDQFTTTGWPWRAGNEFRLLDDGGDFFARMLQAIDAASRYVLLEMYLVRSGAVATRFSEAFARCARRGVRVCLVLDAFGALGFTRADRRRLLDAGVELRLFNPLRLRNRLANLLRDHRKLLLTDGSVAFVGGAGLTDDFAPGAPRGPWRELMVEIEGPVITDWQRAFARTWRRCGPELALPDPPLSAPRAGGAAGRLALSEARQRSVLANGVLRRIDCAATRAWIMSAYFVPSRRFRKALRRCVTEALPHRARSAAAIGASAPGSIACARASPACSTANSIAGAEAARRLRYCGASCGSGSEANSSVLRTNASRNGASVRI